MRDFGSILVENGVITQKMLDDTLLLQRQSNRRLQDLLLDSKLITSENVAEAFRIQGYKSAQVNTIDITEDLIYEAGVDVGYLLANCVIPTKVEDNVLHIVVADPLNYIVVDTLKEQYNVIHAVVYVDSKDNINNKIYKLFPSYVSENTEEDSLDLDIDDESILEDINVLDSPLVRQIDNILFEAIRIGASDIHIEPQEKEDTIVRLRIDGDLTEFNRIDKKWRNHAVARIKILSKLDISKRREAQDGEFA